MTNGEKYKTAEERTDGFRKFCTEFETCIGCSLYSRNHPRDCTFAWLDLEYKAELKPCPFCGKVPTLKTELNACSKPRYYYVACSCGATFTNADCEADAIAMWNRRVK
jgi:Lar family restriction alleviation protein